MRDGISLLDRAITYQSVASKNQIDDEDIRSMLGLADKTKVIRILQEVFKGNSKNAINIQADVSESESNFINAITEYNITLSKLERLTLIEKKDICNLNTEEENESNNYFYKFILENNLKKSCGEII